MSDPGFKKLGELIEKQTELISKMAQGVEKLSEVVGVASTAAKGYAADAAAAAKTAAAVAVVTAKEASLQQTKFNDLMMKGKSSNNIDNQGGEEKLTPGIPVLDSSEEEEEKMAETKPNPVVTVLDSSEDKVPGDKVSEENVPEFNEREYTKNLYSFYNSVDADLKRENDRKYKDSGNVIPSASIAKMEQKLLISYIEIERIMQIRKRNQDRLDSMEFEACLPPAPVILTPPPSRLMDGGDSPDSGLAGGETDEDESGWDWTGGVGSAGGVDPPVDVELGTSPAEPGLDEAGRDGSVETDLCTLPTSEEVMVIEPISLLVMLMVEESVSAPIPRETVVTRTVSTPIPVVTRTVSAPILRETVVQETVFGSSRPECRFVKPVTILSIFFKFGDILIPFWGFAKIAEIVHDSFPDENRVWFGGTHCM